LGNADEVGLGGDCGVDVGVGGGYDGSAVAGVANVSVSNDDSVVGGIVGGGDVVGGSRFEDNGSAEGDGCARDCADDGGAVAGVGDVSVSNDDSVVAGVVGGRDPVGSSRFKNDSGAEGDGCA